jgi:putative component of membrane protein insertase Oxa1/YidC/SpoIIIJ protein YidD
MQRVGIAGIRLYQRFLSRYTTPCPEPESCSAYALRAVREHGLRAGLELAVLKVKHCGK